MLPLIICLGTVNLHQTSNKSQINDSFWPTIKQHQFNPRESTCPAEISSPKPNSGHVRVYPYSITATNWRETEVQINNIRYTYIQTDEQDRTASTTFNGTRVYINAYKDSGLGQMDVYLDGVFSCTVVLSLSENEDSGFKYVYDSGEMAFGQHTVQVKPNENNQNQIITFNYFEYLPRFNYTGLSTLYPNSDFVDPTGQVQYGQRQTGLLPQSFEFECARVWITGVRGTQPLDFTIGLDGVEYNCKLPSISSQFYSVLLFESPILPLRKHTLTLQTNRIIVNGEVKDYALGICSFIISQQPENTACIHSEDMFMQNGQLGRKGTYEIVGPNSSFEFSYFGLGFHFISIKDGWNANKFRVFDNQTQIYEGTNSFSGPTEYFRELFCNSSLIDDLNSHTIQIVNIFTGDNDYRRYIYCYYVFYYNKPDDLPPYYSVLLSKDFTQEGSWATNDDDIETNGQNSVSFEYDGFDLWLEAYTGPFNCNVTVSIDEGQASAQEHQVSLYKEQYGYDIFFNTRNLEVGKHTVKITNNDCSPLRLSKGYYRVRTPTSSFSSSQLFTNSESFTLSSVFSVSDAFSESLSFSFSTEFTKSAVFTNLPDSTGGNKLPKYFSLMMGVICGAFALLAIVVVLIVIYKRRQKAKEEEEKEDDDNEESGAHEANATNSILANSITQTVVDDNDINSWDHEFFEDKNMNYEEDRNEFFKFQ